MLEIFQYSFMIRAFIAGLVIGSIAPLLGNFLVMRRYSLIADTLAHVALAGVAIGLLVGVYPLIPAIIITVITSVVVERLRTDMRISGETVLAMFLPAGLSIALVLISFANGVNVNLFGYLFGSISTVTQTDLWLILGLGTITISVIALLYKQLLYASFDYESARISGIPVRMVNTILIILTAVIVSLAIRVVGVLLVGALMVIPVVTATRIGKSFKHTVILSIGFALLSVITGLFLAYYINLPAGAAIVLSSLFLFGLIAILPKGRGTAS
ncbi:MAG: metal ABC transporter permease [Candidatus Vogelbacteria bacterium]|nr:metal ABC transporter permease [Candidatus Vogelbacteria bacterium]